VVEAQPEAPLYGASHALIVGVDRYAHLPAWQQLACAENDARAVRAMLVSRYGFPAENVRVLLGPQATRAAIETALNDLAGRRFVGPDDRVLVFFAGHGRAVRLPSGALMGFLLPHDARAESEDPDPRELFATCLSMRSIWEKLEATAAKHVLLIADACFSGLLARPRSLDAESRRTDLPALREWAARPARQVLTASGREQAAREDPTRGHGFFTLKLLEELGARAANPDRPFPASLLAWRLQESVPRIAPHQAPQFASHGDAEGQFLFTPTPPRPVPPLVEAGPGVPDADPGPRAPAWPQPPPWEPPAGREPGDRLTVPVAGTDLDLEFVWVPAGSFPMGCDRGGADQRPRHEVVLTRGFWLLRTEVTRALYAAYLAAESGPAPAAWAEPRFGDPRQPVVGVSWLDARRFSTWLTCATGLPCALPTEAQWEYAARGPGGAAFPWGSPAPTPTRAVFGRSLLTGAPEPAGTAEGATWCGALDMAGNAAEWCADWYAPGWQGVRVDPLGPPHGLEKVLRGGSWLDGFPDLLRTTHRHRARPDGRAVNQGFRVVIAGPARG